MDRLDCSVCNGKQTRRSYGYEFEESPHPYSVAKILYLYHCTSCGDNTRVDFESDGTYTENHIETSYSHWEWTTP